MKLIGDKDYVLTGNEQLLHMLKAAVTYTVREVMFSDRDRITDDLVVTTFDYLFCTHMNVKAVYCDRAPKKMRAPPEFLVAQQWTSRIQLFAVNLHEWHVQDVEDLSTIAPLFRKKDHDKQYEWVITLFGRDEKLVPKEVKYFR